ncbi:hypothetical protein D3C73_897290 [compost metagenome]
MIRLAELPYRFTNVFSFGGFDTFEGIEAHGESGNGRLGIGHASGLGQVCLCNVVSFVSQLGQTFRPGRERAAKLGRPPLRLSQLAH